MNNYYYLISSLPVLGYDYSGQLADHSDILLSIHDNLSDTDLGLFKYLQYPADIKQISNYFYEYNNRAKPYRNLHEITSLYPDSIEDILNGNFGSDYLFSDYLGEIYSGKSEFDPAECEARLWEIFFQSVEGVKDSFLINWYAFDHQLRKAIHQSNKRKFDISATNGSTQNWPEWLERPDFDLPENGEFIHNGNTPVELESILDKIRWHYLDKLSSFSFFSLHQVFSWYLKYLLLERWVIPHDEQTPKTELETILKHTTNA